MIWNAGRSAVQPKRRASSECRHRTLVPWDPTTTTRSTTLTMLMSRRLTVGWPVALPTVCCCYSATHGVNANSHIVAPGPRHVAIIHGNCRHRRFFYIHNCPTALTSNYSPGPATVKLQQYQVYLAKILYSRLCPVYAESSAAIATRRLQVSALAPPGPPRWKIAAPVPTARSAARS